MTVDTHTTETESDPLAAALQDAAVGARLLTVALVLLGRRAYALTAIQRHSEAEEIVAEAQTRAWARRSQYDPQRDAYAWLSKFVSNVVYEFVKKRAREQNQSLGDTPLEEFATDSGPSVADVVSDRIQTSEVLSRLTPLELHLLWLKYWEDLSFREIAERLEQTESAVRQQHHRLITRLHAEYATDGEVQS